jgi:hypothetical protein
MIHRADIIVALARVDIKIVKKYSQETWLPTKNAISRGNQCRVPEFFQPERESFPDHS